jgi:hypothetical protein
MRGPRVLMVCAVVALVALAHVTAHAQAPRFEIVVPANVRAEQVTGRLLLMLARTAQPEPRFTVSPQGSAIFGIDVEQLAPGQPAILDDSAIGCPVALSELPAGEYFAQAVINVYERVQRSDGHTLWLPMTDGTIVSFAGAPGNLYSTPQPVHVGEGGTVRIEVSQVVSPVRRPEDTDWVKRVRIQSEKLTRFWGRPIYAQTLTEGTT